MTDREQTVVMFIKPEDIEAMNDTKQAQPFRIDTVAFIYMMGGRGKLLLNLSEYELEKRDFVTILPGSLLKLVDWSGDFNAYLILFSNHYLMDLDLWKNAIYSVPDIIKNPVLHTTDDRNASFMGSYCKMLHEIYINDGITYKEEIMKNMLEAIMFAVSGFYKDQCREEHKNEVKFSRNYELLTDFVHLVAKHYEYEREVAFYADRMCITPKHLGYVVKSTSGLLASETIAAAVIMDAKSKLKSTNMTVRQISDSLNFPNPSFFGKYFKKHVGITPKQYRDN